MKIGAHISGAGNLPGLLEKAKLLNVDCFQMFASPPSNWNKPKYTDEQKTAFKPLVKEAGLGPNFFHAIYLLNFGADNPELLRKSIDSLIGYLTIAPAMAIDGAIFHTGSHKGFGFDALKGQVCKAFDEILASTPKESQLVIENNAGQGNLIGRNAEEIAALLDGVKDNDRIKVAIDTCHAFANGTDWRIPNAVDDFVRTFDHFVGWEKVVVIHANDSKFDIGQNKDRHANIGEGFIGEVGWRNILTHPKFQSLPFILEVPGFAEEGPDKKNVDILRRLAGL